MIYILIYRHTHKCRKTLWIIQIITSNSYPYLIKISTCDIIYKYWVPRLQIAWKLPGRLVKTPTSGPPTEFLIQQTWCGAWEFAYLTSSQGKLILLFREPLWELLTCQCHFAWMMKVWGWFDTSLFRCVQFNSGKMVNSCSFSSLERREKIELTCKPNDLSLL